MSDVLQDNVPLSDAAENNILQAHSEKIDLPKSSLMLFGTSKLWLQYMEMVDLLKKFIKAEHTGKWLLHLQCLYDMLPYFAASGHNMYLKSAYLYLQKMDKLSTEHPEVFKHYVMGIMSLDAPIELGLVSPLT